MAFYDVFKRLCNEKGVTPTQVARDNELTQQTVSHWKTRGSTPKAETIQKLANYFGVTPGYLMGVDSSALSHMRESLLYEQHLLDHLLYGLSKGEADERTIDTLSRLSTKWSVLLPTKLYEYMAQLNEAGQQKVVERAEELTEIPRFRRQDAPETAPQSTLNSNEGKDTTPPPEGAEGPPEGGETG